MSQPRAVTPLALTDRLFAVTDRAGAERRLVLPVTAMGLVLLGTGPDTSRELFRGAQEHPRPGTVLTGTLRAIQSWFPYLFGHLEPLLTISEDGSDKVVGDLFGVLAGVPLEDVAEQAHGDLLGTLYTDVIAPGDRSARGAFYTPAHVGHLMAGIAPVSSGDTFHEPCVGCGGLVIATIREMRSRGVAPETIHWVIGEVDRLALACAGIQLAAHGMLNVTLQPGNMFARPATA